MNAGCLGGLVSLLPFTKKAKKPCSQDAGVANSTNAKSTSASTDSHSHIEHEQDFSPFHCCAPFASSEAGYSYGSDKPPAYSLGDVEQLEIWDTNILEFIEKKVDEYSDELRKLSLDIHGQL
jgi:hypothetical protein